MGEMSIISHGNGIKSRRFVFRLFFCTDKSIMKSKSSKFQNSPTPVTSCDEFRQKYLKMGEISIISLESGIKSRNFAFRLILA